MSFSIVKAFQNIFGQQSARVILIGLDNVGKTSFSFKLTGMDQQQVPTISSGPDSMLHRNIQFTFWELGFHDTIRPLVQHYYTNSDAIIFVVDSTDQIHMNAAKNELFKLINENLLGNAPVLILANKQDLPTAKRMTQLTAELGLNEIRNREWFIQPCCALTGEGLLFGMDWLARSIKKRRRQM